MLGTLAQHPALMQAYHTFNGHILYTNTLDARQRELLVLRVAARRGAEYEWRQHVYIARDLGFTDADIERIAEGPHAAGWSPLDAAMLRAVDELVADAEISDDTWAVLAGELDRHQLMDLVFTVGAYDLLAMAFKSFGVGARRRPAAPDERATRCPPIRRHRRRPVASWRSPGRSTRRGRAPRTGWSSSSTPRAS